MSRGVYFEPFAGASGDMILGALLGLGCPVEVVNEVVARLGLSGWRVEARQVTSGGLAAYRAVVEGPAGTEHRHLSDIEKLVQQSGLPPDVVERSLAVFRRLAEAEAQVHGVGLEQVHFHEVGADDALIDIVGTAAALQHLRVEELYCASFPVGEGRIRCQHGEIPNPGPATMRLLQGWPLRSVDCDLELVTPTGAAILTTLARQGRPSTTFTVEQTSLGAGRRDPGFANVLRASLVHTRTSSGWERLTVLECHLDDCSGELLGYVMERLFEAGALEVSTAPLTMKKSRPGHLLFCLGRPEHGERLADLILSETSTLGVRRNTVERLALPREQVEVETEFGVLEVKRTVDPEGRSRVSPEYEQARRLAHKHGVPLRVVFDAALKACHPIL